MTKNIAALLTAIALGICSLAPVSVMAEESGKCGDNLSYSIASDGSLAIEGSGAMYDYAAGEAPWCKNSAVKTVSIGEGVLSVGENAFFGCELIEAVTLPQSLETVGADAFLGCASLESVKVGASVKAVDSGAFDFCKSLTKIEVDESNSYYSHENGVLYNKDKTELILYPMGKTESSYIVASGVKSIADGAFKWAFALESITLPDTLETVGDGAFMWCSALKTVTLPKNVKSVGRFAFLECEALTEIKADKGNLTYADIDGVLFSRDKTKLVFYPAGKTETQYSVNQKVTAIGEYAFYGAALEKVFLPGGVTSVGDSAFYGCGGLKDVYYNGIEKNWSAVSVAAANKPLQDASIHFAPVSVTARLGFDEGALAIDFVFETEAEMSVCIKSENEAFSQSFDISPENNVVGISTTNSNVIYLAASSEGEMLPVKASLYSVVIDEILSGGYNDSDNAITKRNLALINEVLNNGGIYDDGALTDETARIIERTQTDEGVVYTLTQEAVNAGLRFNSADNSFGGETTAVSTYSVGEAGAKLILEKVQAKEDGEHEKSI